MVKVRFHFNKTVIRNHCAGSTYVYPFYHSSNRVINDNQWHKSQHIIKGASSIFEFTEEKFRKGTKYIKLGIYCNKGGDIWFNHLKLEEIPIQ